MKILSAILMSALSVSVAAKTLRLEVPETIDTSEETTLLVHAIQSAGKGDEVLLGITSGGGNVIQGMRILDAIRNSEATIKCEVSGMAASMAALIATVCPSLKVNPGAIILFHHIFMTDPKTGKKVFSKDIISVMLARYTNSIMKTVLSEEDYLRVLNKEDVVISAEQFSANMCIKRGICA